MFCDRLGVSIVMVSCILMVLTRTISLSIDYDIRLAITSPGDNLIFIEKFVFLFCKPIKINYLNSLSVKLLYPIK